MSSHCINPLHEHCHDWSREGIQLEQPVPMLCHDCAEPAHYDQAVETYVHDDLEAEGCFLIPERPEGATGCQAYQVATTLAEHEAQMPGCQDPDCEFHHPELVEWLAGLESPRTSPRVKP